MSDFWTKAGDTALNAVVGAGSNALNQFINTEFGKIMADHNYELNEKAAGNADERRRALYADFESPAAKIRQLKEAGLSPSIYAGGELGGGIGATSGAQGAGASGAGIPSTAAQLSMAEVELKRHKHVI